MSFEITELRNSTVWQLYRMRDRIQLDPEYQRLGGIWTLESRQLLIDSILNGFDIPKLYLHKFSAPLEVGKRAYDFAIIDGKQRLETIWQFIDGGISLDSGFKYFKDSSVSAASMTYSELGHKYPELKADFDGYPLTAICIETDDLEMIEEMFSRLNEAVPLTAAEKRNALGGPIPVAIRKLAKEKFFTSCIPFSNRRYRHYDLIAKFLLAENSGKVVDTKKPYLDRFVASYAGESRSKVPPFVKKTDALLTRMTEVFVENDWLLQQVGMVVLYYLVFRFARDAGWPADQLSRKKFADFHDLRTKNRAKAEKDLATADYELIEFDQFGQSPNDGYALRLRLRVILAKAFGVSVKADDL